MRWLAGLAAAALAVGAAAEQRTFTVELASGKVSGSADTLRVRKGDEVVLKWSSDRRIALHLHGYDIERTVTPQAPASMSFKADVAGRFPVTEHGHGAGHHRAVLYLEVHP